MVPVWTLHRADSQRHPPNSRPESLSRGKDGRFPAFQALRTLGIPCDFQNPSARRDLLSVRIPPFPARRAHLNRSDAIPRPVLHPVLRPLFLQQPTHVTSHRSDGIHRHAT